jgi:hypothetical protein
MLKKVALFIAAVSVILIVVAVVAFPPTRWEKTEGTIVCRYERSWKLLPRSEWSFLPESMMGCGFFGSTTRRQFRFGFFALSEERRIELTVAAQQEQRVTASH